MPPSYLDFDLQITHAATAGQDPTYAARVLSSPVGQAKINFQVPFSPDEIFSFDEKIAYVNPAGDDSFYRNTLVEFGSALFQALFRDELLVCLSRSIDHASRNNSGLRIRLRLNEVPELLQLPWEYLYHRALRRFLTLSIETSLIHFLELPQPYQAPVIATPLRILVLTASPSDLYPIDVSHEQGNIQRALSALVQRNLVTIDHLTNPTLQHLQRTLRRREYHILHFIGHGDFDERNQSGRLFFADENKQSMAIDARKLGILIHNEPTLRLVVLNSCEGAQTSQRDPFSGVAQTLVQSGVPAVVAMQRMVSDAAALTFSHEFYAAMADGYPVDAALTEARVALSTRTNGGEWGTPRLLMHAEGGLLWQLTNAHIHEPSREVSSPVSSEGRLTATNVNRDLNVLAEFLQLPEISVVVARFRTDFRAAREQIARLSLYKDIHDLLHNLEFLCYRGMEREARRFPDDIMAISILSDHELTLRDIATRLQGLVEDSSLPGGDIRWMDNIAEAQQQLSTALRTEDRQALNRAIWLLKRVLDRTPSRINERLNAAARALRLRPIEEALRTVQSSMAQLQVEPEKVRQFEDAVRAITVLGNSLQVMVDEHDRWQLLDLELRRIEAMVVYDLTELEMSWPDLSTMTASLSEGVTAAWASAFTQDRQQLDEALQADNPSRIRLGFQRLRRQAGNRFYQIDTDLRNLCDELRQIGEPVILMLQMLESGHAPGNT